MLIIGLTRSATCCNFVDLGLAGLALGGAEPRSPTLNLQKLEPNASTIPEQSRT